MTHPRLIRRLAACIVLGLITTWLVAWAIAVVPPRGDTGYSFETVRLRPEPGGRVVDLSRRDAPGYTCKHYIHGMLCGSVLQMMPEPTILEKRDMGWGLPAETFTGEAAQWRAFVEIGTGWPARAFWYAEVPPFGVTRRADGVPSATIIGGLPMPDPSDVGLTGLSPSRGLPCTPIWSGLAIDTGVYAAVWAAGLVLPAAIRSRTRRRRGLCTACGYDLAGGDGCPECGAGLAPA